MPAPDIFLSYNREDAAVARLYADAFAAAGLDMWWDVTLRSREDHDEVTETALREARAVVALWSPHSVASRWVRAEATIVDRNKTLMPVTIEPCNHSVMFELKQTVELTHWRGEAQSPGRGQRRVHGLPMPLRPSAKILRLPNRVQVPPSSPLTTKPVTQIRSARLSKTALSVARTSRS